MFHSNGVYMKSFNLLAVRTYLVANEREYIQVNVRQAAGGRTGKVNENMIGFELSLWS